MNGGIITNHDGSFNLDSAAGRLYRWFRENPMVEMSTKQLDHLSDELGFGAAVQRVMEIREQLDPKVEWICRRIKHVDRKNVHYYAYVKTNGQVPSERPAIRRLEQILKGEGKPVRGLGVARPAQAKPLEEALPAGAQGQQGHIFDPRPNW